MPGVQIVGVEMLFSQSRAASNSRRRPDWVMSPVTSSACGRSCSSQARVAATAAAFSQPKWMSETWARRRIIRAG